MLFAGLCRLLSPANVYLYLRSRIFFVFLSMETLLFVIRLSSLFDKGQR